MSKHTPGPWQIQEASNHTWLLLRGTFGGRGHHPQSHLQIVPEADARLIAAAPDLLEALKGIRADAERFALDVAADAQEGGEFNSREHSKWQAVAAAIAKAEGNQ